MANENVNDFINLITERLHECDRIYSVNIDNMTAAEAYAHAKEQKKALLDAIHAVNCLAECLELDHQEINEAICKLSELAKRTA